MAKPAARVGDHHTCPQVTPGSPPVPHVGGPVLPAGASTTLIGSQPAASVTGMCACVGPPDTIVTGSLGVIVGNLCAACAGDPTAHGGTIVGGTPSVQIGQVDNAVDRIAKGVNPSGSTVNCGHNVDSAISRLYGTDPNATSPAGMDGSFAEIGSRHGTQIEWGKTLDDAFTTV